ncbi:MAG: CBS domain-containing protein [Candidatus Altiarchaeum hamiconexum]|uniref:CBS domain-containing protein n=1 Tax=Candidatus Altarchaeum hamiconexum TaxID=1803513 RepID=A0A8J7YT23_9ARCH|nr:CBS domain-containing protein [Candidatus Altarchaeum hamiconexum]OIQ05826.1 MAG: hypothetical protein AUK59_02310 [Candidatus Altarchaeum sp. CG2_30_32_3053]PIN67204.1 MAG: hypothetical protein COV98_04140 [Candidatus Altarchaeum sp. CG12_big_fil_rev_8_21_14_0_65_33_22]PIV28137.1 MAG: hypothetical protein COS36_03250 [Candidatus Altarchaeum sp. CG03_land_8_20_14_0_80_32_618]PIX48595.1 MAG: hypothetical protein COZ53_03510 [Candidatus Altarchaeum sp. CG_4_8_14_3_um_filter_33_2054]PIZ31048.1
MRVKDIMSKDVKTCKLDDKISDVSREMTKYGISMLVVVEKDTPVGVITKSDVATRVVGEGKEPNDVKVRDVYSAPIRKIYAMSTIELFANKLHARNLRNMVVFDEDEKMVGVCGTTDILKLVAEGKYV